MEDNNIQIPEHRRTDRISYAEKGRFFKLRNILNIIFMLLAVVGMALYFFTSQTIGGIVLVVAVVVKGAECVLRLLH